MRAARRCGRPARRAVNRRVLLALAVAATGFVAVAAAVVVLPAGGDEEGRTPRAVDLGRCQLGLAAQARDCYTREFLALVEGGDDPRPAVAAITKAARREGGFILANCHVVMHTVGRTYAHDAGVTLGTLMDHLPEDNDPGCPAGFAHGLVTGVAPDIDPRRPREALSVCGKAGTRFQRYSCIHGFGHAFMRIYEDRLDLALPLCRALGPQSAPDCGQGAYHDYWLAVLGADDASAPADAVSNPRELCAAQPAEFVRPCWYRSFLENRSEGFTLDTPEDLQGLCDGLAGIQREGCITAAALIGPPDPVAQLAICARLRDPADAASCVRGTKVQNLLDAPTRTYVRLIGRCRTFARAPRSACYRWLGKALAVLTDGGFARDGCPRLAGAAARRECLAGARTMEDALVTFS
jgi:hypothetical protein